MVIITRTALIFTDVFRPFEKHFPVNEPNFYYGCNSDNLFLLPARTQANMFFQIAQFSHIHPLLIQIQQRCTLQPQSDGLSTYWYPFRNRNFRAKFTSPNCNERQNMKEYAPSLVVNYKIINSYLKCLFIYLFTYLLI